MILLFFVRPAGRVHQEVQVLYRPDRGNFQPDGKGVRREVESEGSRRQSPGFGGRRPPADRSKSAAPGTTG